MLQLETPTLTFASDRPPFHDGMNEEAAAFELVCIACGQPTKRNALSAISAGEPWYRNLHREEQREIAAKFGLKFSVEGPRELPYARMPNGRHAYFSAVVCSHCNGKAVVALDFYERQPARYIGTIQGVAAISAQPGATREA